MIGRLVAVALGCAALVSCGKSTAPSASTPSAGLSDGAAGVGSAVAPSGGEDGGVAPMDAREAAAWAAASAGGAQDGDPEELARLAGLVGCEGLRERADRVELRGTALRAMQFCGDFSELPWLAQVATTGSDEDARAALDAAVELAARPRRAADPEDAEELHVGCGALLDLARSAERPRERRVLAIRALRMLSERGCVKRGEIPTELDAR
jgi:hypothetical protein